MTTLADLLPIPVWLNPGHLASSARLLLQGHGLTVIAVAEDGRPVGLLFLEDLSDSFAGTVGERMRRNPPCFDSRETIRSAAKEFADHEIRAAVLTKDEKCAGVITSAMLLRALGKSFDPMTGLSWSDELRSWAVENLVLGHEISILFIDLNNFREYNKKHGHTVGDKVLRTVADYLQGRLNTESDLLVRYAGDEFAIGTRRLRAESEALAQSLREGAKGLPVQEGVEPVTFSVGVFGGQRTKERENTHYQSTVENLILEASKRCLTAKNSDESPMPKASVTHAAYRVESVQENGDVVTVILSSGGQVLSGTEALAGRRAEEAVVAATLKAMARREAGLTAQLTTLALVTMEGQTMLNLKGVGKRAETEFLIDLQHRSASSPLVAVAEALIRALSSGQNAEQAAL